MLAANKNIYKYYQIVRIELDAESETLREASEGPIFWLIL